MDPEVVRRLREFLDGPGSWPPELRDLLADWERRGEALRQVSVIQGKTPTGELARAALAAAQPKEE